MMQAPPPQDTVQHPPAPRFVHALTRLAWVFGLACVACCSLPAVTVGLGLAGGASLLAYAEPTAATLALLGLAALGLSRYLRWRQIRRDGPACSLTR